MANNGIIDLPMPALAGYGGARAAATLPMLAIEANGRLRFNSADLELLRLTLLAAGGAALDQALPALTISAAGTVTVSARADISLPALAIAAAGTVPVVGRLGVTLPMLDMQAAGAGTGQAALPMLVVQASGTVSLTARAALALPSLSIAARATVSARASADLTLPMLTVQLGVRGLISLPSLQMEALASLVQSVSYVAWTMNLMPGQGMPHQVTQYTNFPFNQIVRWGDDYYGVADDGLYLLGGDTDYDSPTPAPIPWRVRSALTNFGSRQMTVVRETVLHGRIGDTVTAKVRVSEGTDHTYAALITRGSTARASRIKYGKGLKAEFWGFELADSLGSTLQLDGWQHDPQTTSRKV